MLSNGVYPQTRSLSFYFKVPFNIYQVSMVLWMVKNKRTVYHWELKVPFNIYQVSMVLWMVKNKRVYHWELKVPYNIDQVSMVLWMVKNKRTVYHWELKVPFNIYQVSMVLWMVKNKRVYHWELKRTISPYFRNLPLLHITIRLHLTSRLLKFMQWLARKQYVLRSW